VLATAAAMLEFFDRYLKTGDIATPPGALRASTLAPGEQGVTLTQ